MLFEKALRRKKTSPFILELFGLVVLTFGLVTIFISFLFLVCLYNGNSFENIYLTFLIIFIAFIVLMPAALILNGYVTLLQGIDIKRKIYKKQQIVIIDHETYFVAMSSRSVTESILYLFFREPYILKGEFITLPYGTEIVHIKPFQLHFPPHWTYRFHRDYQHYKEEYKKTLPPKYKKGAVSGRYKNPNIDRYEEEMYDSFFLYFTYEKVQVLNRLFELVNPPEFRITKYEKSWVFISIDPIPGKEYPPEALECMEKINAMYP